MNSVKHIGDVVCAIIERNGRILIAQRSPGKSLAFKWEFPGGKVEEGECAPEALRRELREELGITVAVHRPLTPVLYAYESFSLRLLPFLCEIESGEPVLHEHCALAWVMPEMIGSYDFPSADIPILAEYLLIRSGRSA